MYSSTPGQVLPAAISVLPTTAAFTLFPQISASGLATTVGVLAGLWLVSYLGTTLALKAIKK